MCYVKKMLQARNTKKQGDIGAIAWGAKRGYTVCIPLSDSQEYDLVIEMPEGLKRIQVKTTKYVARRLPHHKGAFSAELRTKIINNQRRANKSVKSRNLNRNVVDYVFIVTGAGGLYLIPSQALKGVSRVQLGKHYDKYKTEL